MLTGVSEECFLYFQGRTERKGGTDKGDRHEGVSFLSDPIRIRRPVKEFKALRRAILSEHRGRRNNDYE